MNLECLADVFAIALLERFILGVLFRYQCNGVPSNC